MECLTLCVLLGLLTLLSLLHSQEKVACVRVDVSPDTPGGGDAATTETFLWARPALLTLLTPSSFLRPTHTPTPPPLSPSPTPSNWPDGHHLSGEGRRRGRRPGACSGRAPPGRKWVWDVCTRRPDPQRGTKEPHCGVLHPALTV